MLLSIPVGRDGVYPPWHRVYGVERIAKLLDGWTIEEESYWAQVDGERYEPVSRESALAERGSAAYYALGLLKLSP